MRQDAAGARRRHRGDAARLYERLGWVRVGEIPGYALLPQGGLCSTTVYYRNLGG